MTPSQRSLLKAAVPIGAFWALMSGLLWHRERSAPRVDWQTDSARLTEPSESWMGLFTSNGQRIGTVHMRQLPEERRRRLGATLRLVTRMELHLLGHLARLDLEGSLWRAYESAVAELDFTVRSGEHDLDLEAVLEDGVLRGVVHTAGDALPLEVPLEGDLVLAGGFGSALRFPPLEIGERVELDSFDPLTLKASSVEVRCTARQQLRIGTETVSTRVLEVDTAGLPTKAWIDDDGDIIRAETALGLVLEKITAEEALQLGDTLAPSDLLGLTAIRPTGMEPRRGLKRLIIHLQHHRSAARALPSDERQSRDADDEDRYTILALGPEEATTVALVDPTPYLRSDPFVQANHPRIRRQAEEILQGISTDEPWRRAVRLYDWVYETIDKEPVLSLPSALEVLQNRRGDCNEHTVLYTALARAAGIPTRMAIGIVWSDQLDGFYYHAWPVVYADGRWVAMDPTLGQQVADATHIKLLEGGIERWTQLLPYLGQLDIEVLEMTS